MSEQDPHNSSDFSDDEEFEEDNESTLAEEEALLNENEDVDEELRLLNEEGEMTVEELRRRYYGDPNPEPALPSDIGDQPCSSTLPNLAATDPLNSYFDNSLGSDDEDEEYVPKTAEYWKKEVRIGDNYQASSVPNANDSLENYHPVIESNSLWRPTRTDDEPEKLNDFLNKVNILLYEQECEANGMDNPQANRPPKSTAFADNEDALYALLKHGYDSEETIKHLPFPPANGPRITGPNTWRVFTPDDIDAFETGFREHGKNFFLIRKHELQDRTIGELVNFYYIWKKTERHDMFLEANRALGIPDSNTKTIDPMDLLADQQLDEVNGIAYAAATVLNAQASTTSHQHKNWLSVQHSSTTSSSSQPKQ